MILPCFKCRKELLPAFPDSEDSETVNQPMEGIIFHAEGNWGSEVFDPMDGSWLEINICDDCLRWYHSMITISKIAGRWEPPKTTKMWKP